MSLLKDILHSNSKRSCLRKSTCYTENFGNEKKKQKNSTNSIESKDCKEENITINLASLVNDYYSLLNQPEFENSTENYTAATEGSSHFYISDCRLFFPETYERDTANISHLVDVSKDTSEDVSVCVPQKIHIPLEESPINLKSTDSAPNLTSGARPLGACSYNSILNDVLWTGFNDYDFKDASLPDDLAKHGDKESTIGEDLENISNDSICTVFENILKDDGCLILPMNVEENIKNEEIEPVIEKKKHVRTCNCSDGNISLDIKNFKKMEKDKTKISVTPLAKDKISNASTHMNPCVVLTPAFTIQLQRINAAPFNTEDEEKFDFQGFSSDDVIIAAKRTAEAKNQATILDCYLKQYQKAPQGATRFA